MTAASSFNEYILAIEEVLVSGSSAAAVYPIAVDSYNLDYYWEGKELQMISDDALLRPQLALRSEETSTGNGSANALVGQNDREIYNVTVDVLMAHNLLDGVEMKNSRMGYLKSIQEDARKIKAAMEHAGNLSTTIAGDPTGLASGCLYDGRWSSLQLDHKQNVHLSRIRFKAILLVTVG